MKPLSEVTTQALQRIKRSPVSLLKNSAGIANQSTTSLSLYSGSLSNPAVIENVVKLKRAFPSLPAGFYEVFSDRLVANGFGDDRLRDAVDHVIDTCVYPTPTIAQFMGFDQRIEINTYEAMLKKAHEFGVEAWNNYTPIKFPDREKPVWVRNDDVKKYHIKSERN